MKYLLSLLLLLTQYLTSAQTNEVLMLTVKNNYLIVTDTVSGLEYIPPIPKSIASYYVSSKSSSDSMKVILYNNLLSRRDRETFLPKPGSNFREWDFSGGNLINSTKTPFNRATLISFLQENTGFSLAGLTTALSTEPIELDSTTIEILAYSTEDVNPTGATLNALNTLVTSLKTLDNNGVSAWDSFDYLSLYHTNGDSAFALKNIISNSNNGYLVGNPIYSRNKGFVSYDGTSYINLNWNPFDDAVNYSQNNASIIVYLNSNGKSYDEIAALGFRSGSRSALIAPNRDESIDFQASVNSSISFINNWSLDDSTRLSDGFYMVTRNSSTNENFYNYTGNLKASKTQESNSFIATDWYALGYNNGGVLNPSKSSVAVVGMGSDMSAISSSLREIFITYINNAVNESEVLINADLNIVLDGDSRIRGEGAGNNQNIAVELEKTFLSVETNVKSYSINSFGLNGQKMGSMVSNSGGKFDDLIDPEKTNVLIFLEGVNSIVNSNQDETSTYNQHKTYMSDRRSAGWDYIIAITEAHPRQVSGSYPSANFTTANLDNLVDFINLYKNETNPLFDIHIALDEESEANIGGILPGVEINSFWNDGTHYDQSGYKRIAEIIFNQGLINIPTQ